MKPFYPTLARSLLLRLPECQANTIFIEKIIGNFKLKHLLWKAF